MLIVGHLYYISDEELGFQVRDRYCFSRFLSLYPEDKVPDTRTLWLLREQLSQQAIDKELFMDFAIQLDGHGLKACRGQIVDASFVEAPKRRNSREENAQIKRGETPERFNQNPPVKYQKDVDARWARKNDETHFGYKNHLSVDNEHKLIRAFEVTSASVHDSQVFFELLTDNTSQDVWADSAYCSDENDLMLFALGYHNQMYRKDARNKPLSERQRQANRKRSKVRVRMEYVFGSMENEQEGMFVRTIGLVRARIRICLMNLVYNMRRFVTIHRTVVPV